MAVLCFQSHWGSHNDNVQQSLSCSSSLHIHREETHALIHIKLNMQIYADTHISILKCTHIHITQQQGSVQALMLCGCTAFPFNPTHPSRHLCQSLSLSGWLYPSIRDAAEI
ncbi:hypothetical protein ILYODFUR_030550 [Ilyodon furcidens]|uniref:Uncharacterized protein n=1 Tax=Ilyodon furcidens TaxID=33524 RepID=A0ABV0VKZ5_9TELE